MQIIHWHSDIIQPISDLALLFAWFTEDFSIKQISKSRVDQF
jgi:hypothetical protein